MTPERTHIAAKYAVDYAIKQVCSQCSQCLPSKFYPRTVRHVADSAVWEIEAEYLCADGFGQVATIWINDQTGALELLLRIGPTSLKA